MAIAADYMSLVLKGTRHGLLASIREDADWNLVLNELAGISVSGQGFFTDASLTFDFGWRELTEQQFDQVIEVLSHQGLSCNGILSTSLNTRTIAEERGYRAIIGRLGLAKHHGRRMRREQEETAAIPTASTQDASTIQAQPSSEAAPFTEPAVEIASAPATETATAEATPPAAVIVTATEASTVAGVSLGPAVGTTGAAPPTSTQASVQEASIELPSSPSTEASIETISTPSQEGVHIPRFQDEEPTLYLRKTLRGGQRVVFAGNVILLGDLNPGAAIEADGDIIVLGQLRGSVHAGAEGDRSATVITSSLRATQLRIADCFWQSEKNNSIFKKSPLTGTLKARLDGDSVVVEALPVR